MALSSEEKRKQPKTFAEGMKMINEKGALVIPVNLTKRRAVILLDIVSRGREDFNNTHEEGHFNENDMQAACQWVANQIFKRWSQNELYRLADTPNSLNNKAQK